MLLIVVGTLRVPSLLKKGDKNFTHPIKILYLCFCSHDAGSLPCWRGGEYQNEVKENIWVIWRG